MMLRREWGEKLILIYNRNKKESGSHVFQIQSCVWQLGGSRLSSLCSEIQSFESVTPQSFDFSLRIAIIVMEFLSPYSFGIFFYPLIYEFGLV